MDTTWTGFVHICSKHINRLSMVHRLPTIMSMWNWTLLIISLRQEKTIKSNCWCVEVDTRAEINFPPIATTLRAVDFLFCSFCGDPFVRPTSVQIEMANFYKNIKWQHSNSSARRLLFVPTVLRAPSSFSFNSNVISFSPLLFSRIAFFTGELAVVVVIVVTTDLTVCATTIYRCSS